MGHYEHTYYIVLFSDVYTDDKDTQHKKKTWNYLLLCD